jgi:hypothetical protein
MRRSMLPIPCAYLIVAIVLGIVCTALDGTSERGSRPGSASTARATC